MKVMTIDAQVRMATLLAKSGWTLTPPEHLTNRDISVPTPTMGYPIVGAAEVATVMASKPAPAPAVTALPIQLSADATTLLRAYGRRPAQYLSDVQAAAAVSLHRSAYASRCAELRAAGLIEVKEGSAPRRCRITGVGRTWLTQLTAKPPKSVRRKHAPAAAN